MTTASAFGDWLRERRRRLALTQAELAGRVGCSEITIRKIESGARTPSQQIVELLARSLEIPADEYEAFFAMARHQQVAAAAPRLAPLPLARLPVPMTRLLGRDVDSAAIIQRLVNQRTRLLTLVGPPGIGKTRLSLEAAAALADQYSDGIAFIPLAPVVEASLVLDTIGQALGVSELTRADLMQSLVALLEKRRILLVLDNFEHVLPAAADIARLLEACPGVQVLATSRAALFVRGEQIYQLAPLALPSLSFPLLTEVVARAPAVELFVERAMAVAPYFALTADNMAAVAAICARLDGLPLAIELAAARTRLLSPLALLSRLGNKALLYSAGPRDLPPRHQTLHNAIAWSYNLLSEVEQRLFACLGLFVGEYDLEAVEAVWSGGESQTEVETPALLEVLGALADHHLVRIGVSADGLMRLSMLEVMREFALERLTESLWFEQVHARYVRHYVRLAERAAAELDGPEQERWLNRLDREHDQLRAVLAWTTQATDSGVAGDLALEAPALGMKLGASLWRFWYTRCYLSEGRRWLTALLDSDRDGGPSVERARILLGAGVLARAQGDLVEGARLIDCGLATARQANTPVDVAQSLYYRGVAAFDSGDIAAAIRDLEECLSIQRDRADLAGAASALNGLGSVLIGSDNQRAVILLGESVRLQHQLANRRGEAFALHSLGNAELRHGDAALAAANFRAGLALFQALNDGIGIADCIAGLSAVSGARGQSARAGELWYAAEALRQSVGAPFTDVERATYAVYLGEITPANAEADADLEALVRRELDSQIVQ